MSTNLHAGHRERLRKKYLHDSHGLATHEVLEMLLFHAQPRKNTNEIAHLLIKEFGTIENVFDASPEALMKVKGVSTAITSYLKAFPKLFQAYYNLLEKPHEKVYDLETLRKYMLPRFTDEVNEVIYVAYLDENFEAICCEELQSGDQFHVQSTLNELIQSIAKKDAKHIAIAHNHPCSSCIPSAKDLESTIKIKLALSLVGVGLVDHVIFGVDGYCSVMSIAERK